MLYSELLKEIKNQIGSISSNLNTPTGAVRKETMNSERKLSFVLINEDEENDVIDELEKESEKASLVKLPLMNKEKSLMSRFSSKMFTTSAIGEEKRESVKLPTKEYHSNNLSQLNKENRNRNMGRENRGSFFCAKQELENTTKKYEIDHVRL